MADEARTMTNDKISPFLATSAGLHGVLLLLVLLAPSLFPRRAETSWGTNAGNGVPVGLASRLPGIALPSPPVVTDTAKPNASKALHPAEVSPKALPKTPNPAAIKIPERGAHAEPKPSKSSRIAKADIPAPNNVPTNAIPGPESGQIPLPYGTTGAGTGKASFGGDGTFGTRFPEYVPALIRAIESRWQEPVTRAASRAYVSFTITRSGRSGAVATDIKLAERSGSSQLDSSAMRAVMAAAPSLPPLPAGYSGSSVDVRFYFESKR